MSDRDNSGDVLKNRIAVVALLLAGCAYDLGRLPLATSKTTAEVPYTVVQQGIEATSCSWSFDSYELRISPESIIAFGIDRVGRGANALVDVRIQRTVYPFFLFARDCMTVRGDAVRVGPLATAAQP